MWQLDIPLIFRPGSDCHLVNDRIKCNLIETDYRGDIHCWQIELESEPVDWGLPLGFLRVGSVHDHRNSPRAVLTEAVISRLYELDIHK